ncbi:restriction endonuclease subunit S [Mesorhizobium sp. ZC-5]|uniref:restriction endonuclease subunit S n=1 Tax=Mesorhizobium sp. ZC-5 TaxID=2986066 RepID=UPI0021E73CE0|nr:restriction endonuclease subunit S [Mesorhizobium sp. ZC-5]MCV3243194.1 restriction endonuclease subunit S [Mesorhizobium sp. ZC-5]
MSGPHLGDYFDNRQEPGRPGLPVMSVTMNDSLVLRDDLDRRTESALRPDQHLLVRKGDIAYNMMRMWQGACGLAEADGVVSPAYVVLAPKPGIDSRFAYHWFKSARMIHLFWAYSHGLTEDRLRLYFDAFCEIPAAPPPLEQQKRIAAFLDAWDQAIDQSGRLIRAESARQSVLLEHLFAGRQFGRSEGKPYQQIPLGEISHCYSGGTPDRGDAESFGGGIPWVKSGEIASSDILATEETLSERGLAASSAKWVPAGSTLIAMYGANAGQVGRLRVDATTNQAILAVVPRGDLVTPDYLYHSVINAIPSLLRKVQGSGQPNLSAGIIKEEKILVPSIDDQIKIARVATALVISLQLLQSARAKTINQRQGLMQKLLADEKPLDRRFNDFASAIRIAAGGVA